MRHRGARVRSRFKDTAMDMDEEISDCRLQISDCKPGLDGGMKCALKSGNLKSLLNERMSSQGLVKTCTS